MKLLEKSEVYEGSAAELDKLVRNLKAGWRAIARHPATDKTERVTVVWNGEVDA